MVTDSGLGSLRVPQNLEAGRKGAGPPQPEVPIAQKFQKGGLPKTQVGATNNGVVTDLRFQRSAVPSYPSQPAQRCSFTKRQLSWKT
jgi:hypothetical protein